MITSFQIVAWLRVSRSEIAERQRDFDFRTGKRSKSGFRVVALAMLAWVVLGGAAARLEAALTLHEWHGDSPNSSYWDDYRNWLGGVPGSLSDRVNLYSGADRRLNTNNLASGTQFESINLLDSGYNVYGNAVRITYLTASYPSGTSTFRPDIQTWGDFSVSVWSNAATLNLLGDINLAVNDLIVPWNSLGTLNLQGVIYGSAGILMESESGDLALTGSGANTFTGPTIVSGGNLRLSRYTLPAFSGTTAIPGDLTIRYPGTVLLSRNNQIANDADVTLDFGLLNLDGNSDAVGSIAGNGVINLGTNGALTVGGNGRSTIYSGVIRGTGNLDKTGNGVLTLNGEYRASGAIRVLDGTLRMDHSSTYVAPDISVAAGAVLGGRGTVSDVSVAAGGTLDPGVGSGSSLLYATGHVTLAASSTFRVELANRTSSDAIAVGGAVNLGSSRLIIVPSAGIRVGDSFAIVTKVSAGPVTGTFLGLAEGATFVVDNRLFQITYGGGNGNRCGCDAPRSAVI
jgi:autotransporter-associated beta strand protein